MNSTSLSRPIILLGVVAALNGFLAVALGSFAAHGLQHYASAEQLPTWQTGVRYHMFHVMAAFIAMVISGHDQSHPANQEQTATQRRRPHQPISWR